MTSESITLLAWSGPILVILGVILLIAHPRIQKGLSAKKGIWWFIFGNTRPSFAWGKWSNFDTVKSLAYICLIVGIFCVLIATLA